MKNSEIIETEYYLKEIKFPIIPINPDKEYTFCLNFDGADQLMVQNVNKDKERTAELLKDWFPFSLM